MKYFYKYNFTVLCLMLFQIVSVKDIAGQESAFSTDSRIIYDICFSAYGEVLAIADQNNIKVYRFNDKVLLREFSSGHTDEITAIDMSQDSTVLISGSKDGTIHVWDINTGEIVKTFNQHNGIVTSISISHDCLYFASGGIDEKTTLFDLKNLFVKKEFINHNGRVTVVKFSPNGKLLFTGGCDGNLFIINVSDYSIIPILKAHKDWIRDLDFDSNGLYFTSVGDDGMYTWNISDIDNVSLRRKRKPSRSWTTSIQYFESNQTFVVSTINGRVFVYSPIISLKYKTKTPILKVLNRPNQGSYITIVAATRGRGVIVISGEMMK